MNHAICRGACVLAWCLCLLLGRAHAQLPSQLRASLYCDPAQAAVGEVLHWKLVVEHERTEQVSLAEEDVLASLSELDRLSWAVIAGPTRSVEASAAGPMMTSFVWQVLSLEGGVRTLPNLRVQTAQGVSAEAQGPEIEIWSALGETEDIARPFAPLHEVEIKARGVGPIALLASLALLLVFWMVWRKWRASKRRPVPVAPSARQRFAVIAAAPPTDAAAMRECAFSLAQILRAAADQITGTAQEGLSDEEWLARFGATSGLAADQIQEVGQLLEGFSRMKYAGEQPTPFRLRELLQRVEACLQMLAAKTDTGAKGEAA